MAEPRNLEEYNQMYSRAERMARLKKLRKLRELRASRNQNLQADGTEASGIEKAIGTVVEPFKPEWVKDGAVSIPPISDETREQAAFIGGMAVDGYAMSRGVMNPYKLAFYAGAGGDVIRSAVNTVNRAIAGKLDPRTPEEIAADSGLNILTETLIGGGFGHAASKIGVHDMNAINPTTGLSRNQKKELFERTGTPPTAAMSGGKTTQIFSNVLTEMPFSAGIMEKNADATIQAVDKFALGVAEGYGTVGTKAQTGSRVRKVLAPQKGIEPSQVTWLEKNVSRQNKLFDHVGKYTKETPDIDMSDVSIKLQEKLNAVKELKESQRDAITPQYEKLLNDILDNGDTFKKTKEGKKVRIDGKRRNLLKWDAVQEYKRRIGEMVGDASVPSNATQAELKLLYGLLAEAQMKHIKKLGPEGQKAYEKAMEFSREFNRKKELLSGIIERTNPEDVFNDAYNSISKQGDLIAEMKQAVNEVDPDAWGDFVSTVIHEAGMESSARATKAPRFTEKRAPYGQDPEDVTQVTGRTFNYSNFLKKINEWGSTSTKDGENSLRVLFSAPQQKGLANEYKALIHNLKKQAMKEQPMPTLTNAFTKENVVGKIDPQNQKFSGMIDEAQDLADLAALGKDSNALRNTSRSGMFNTAAQAIKGIGNIAAWGAVGAAGGALPTGFNPSYTIASAALATMSAPMLGKLLTNKHFIRYLNEGFQKGSFVKIATEKGALHSGRLFSAIAQDMYMTEPIKQFLGAVRDESLRQHQELEQRRKANETQ